MAGDKKMTILEKLIGEVQLTKQEITVISFSVVLSASILILNFFYFKAIVETFVYNVVNIIGMSILIIPITIVEYAKYKSSKEMEEQFPDFLRSIVEGLHGGMTLPIAIKYASRSSYGPLDTYIKNLVAQISWGVPFGEAMNRFAKNVGSKAIQRSTSAIIEAHNSGGDIASVIESMGQSFVEIDKLRKEREARIASQMVQGYLIYFIFVGVMIGMQKFLIPALSFSGVGATGQIVGASQNPLAAVAGGRVFIHLAAIQGFFSGLSIGKLAEGRLSAGIKHATILGLFGYSLMTLFG